MENQQTVGTQFKTLNILHIALCLGVVITLAVFRYLVKQETNAVPDKSLLFEILGIGSGFICVMAARFLFFTKSGTAVSVISLKEKLSIYRGAFITQMALLEGAAIFNLLLYYLTKNDMHFFIALGILLLMIVRRPTRAMAAMVLFGKTEDKQQLYDDSLPL